VPYRPLPSLLVPISIGLRASNSLMTHIAKVIEDFSKLSVGDVHRTLTSWMVNRKRCALYWRATLKHNHGLSESRVEWT